MNCILSPRSYETPELDMIFTNLEAILDERKAVRRREYQDWERNIFKSIQRQVKRRLSERAHSNEPSEVLRGYPVIVNPLKDPLKRAESQKALEERVSNRILAALGDPVPDKRPNNCRDSMSPCLWARSGFLSTPEGKESRIGVPPDFFRPMVKSSFGGGNLDGVPPAGKLVLPSEMNVKKPFPLPRYYFRNPILST